MNYCYLERRNCEYAGHCIKHFEGSVVKQFCRLTSEYKEFGDICFIHDNAEQSRDESLDDNNAKQVSDQ